MFILFWGFVLDGWIRFGAPLGAPVSLLLPLLIVGFVTFRYLGQRLLFYLPAIRETSGRILEFHPPSGKDHQTLAQVPGDGKAS